MQNEQDDINDILNEFDFHKVQKAMAALNWTWWDSEDIPTIKELRKTASDLLEYAKNSNSEIPDYMTGTGGFEVTRNIYPGVAKRYYSLKFVVVGENNHD